MKLNQIQQLRYCITLILISATCVWPSSVSITIKTFNDMTRYYSGVARVGGASGQAVIFAPPPPGS